MDASRTRPVRTPPATTPTPDRLRRFCRAAIVAAARISPLGAWYVGCDRCGAVLEGDTGKCRWFATRKAADYAGRAAGWQVAQTRRDAEICPACLANEAAETPDTRIYRTELSRSTSGQWSLHQDSELIARSRDQGMDPWAAQEWAEATLDRHDMDWLNGRFDPDPESGYWVADPHDETADQS